MIPALLVSCQFWYSNIIFDGNFQIFDYWEVICNYLIATIEILYVFLYCFPQIAPTIRREWNKFRTNKASYFLGGSHTNNLYIAKEADVLCEYKSILPWLYRFNIYQALSVASFNNNEYGGAVNRSDNYVATIMLYCYSYTGNIYIYIFVNTFS